MTSIHIHIGAHKTATTHLQDMLASHAQYLSQAGINYVDRESFRRGNILRKINSSWESTNSCSASHPTISAMLGYPDSARTRHVISEENILGYSPELLAGLYPSRTRRLMPWKRLLNGSEYRIFISIRSYADILPSAYSQALRSGFKVSQFSAIREFWLSRKPSWYDLVTDVRSLFPEYPITVWTFDYYIRNPLAIAAALVGVPFAPNIPPIPISTRRLSFSAVERILGLPDDLSFQERREAAKRIVAEHRLGEFDPLSKAEKDTLTYRYELDLDRISGLDRTTLFY